MPSVLRSGKRACGERVTLERAGALWDGSGAFNAMTELDTRVRIDKWLWASRFYKTRSLAADAVDSGKAKLNGERVKPAKLVTRGDVLSIRNGQFSWEVTVLALGERRGSAMVASM